MRLSSADLAHRPWPLPRGPWVMAQSWHDVLFAHWSLPAESLRPLIPQGLDLDLFQGQAWLGVVPFRMTGVRPRLVPALPWLSSFPELNVRTYVVAEGKPGVWFFSLDAGNPLAVTMARAWFHLPYYLARMQVCQEENWISYTSRRTHDGSTPAEFQGRYRPMGEPFRAARGTLEYFLTERYCLYTSREKQRLGRRRDSSRTLAAATR
ncbi:MAG TPA: DUF2071 domain-containing protein [Candidatus Acidoferrales bacterium]|nr:DUF2071 domain-containing protein [Candidatus Acidoferrales bacterium]